MGIGWAVLDIGVQVASVGRVKRILATLPPTLDPWLPMALNRSHYLSTAHSIFQQVTITILYLSTTHADSQNLFGSTRPHGSTGMTRMRKHGSCFVFKIKKKIVKNTAPFEHKNKNILCHYANLSLHLLQLEMAYPATLGANFGTTTTGVTLFFYSRNLSFKGSTCSPMAEISA